MADFEQDSQYATEQQARVEERQAELSTAQEAERRAQEQERRATFHESVVSGQVSSDPPEALPRDLARAREKLEKAIQASRAAQEAVRNTENQVNLATIAAQAAESAAQASMAQAKAEGFRFTTDLNWENFTGNNWEQFIKGNVSVKVGGSEHKFNFLNALRFILGHKLEVCCLGKFAVISPWEHKRVLGSSVASIYGMKKDVVRGAKWDEVFGVKFENHQGPKVTIGPNESTAHSQKQSRIGAWFEKRERSKYDAKVFEPTVAKQTLNILTSSEKISKLSRNIGRATRKVAELEMLVGKYKHQASTLKMTTKQLSMSSDQNILLGGNDAKLELRSFTVLKKGGSNVTCFGSSISLSGGPYKIL